MAKPTTRQELVNYCLRQLGAPVLEINIADEQVDDLLDDALQYFQERHFDGVERTYLKHQINQTEIDQARETTISSSATSTVGVSRTYNWTEAANFIQVPDSIIGVEKVFKFEKSTISSGMFNLKYQMFLNDIHWFASSKLLSYSMTKSRLEDIDHLLTPSNQIRFNKRQNRLYLDIDWAEQDRDTYIVIDCYRILDPSNNAGVYNDSFLKKYLTALFKRQWGQNLIKFQGVQLPGGIQLNGRQIYDDGVKEIDELRAKMSSDYEMPPLDMIG